MTLEEIGNIVASADPAARHYYSTSTDGPYTVWQEYNQISAPGDDGRTITDENPEELGWAFQVERYTSVEFDPIAQRIRNALLEAEGVAFRYMVDFDPQTKVIRHLFDCEGI